MNSFLSFLFIFLHRTFNLLVALGGLFLQLQLLPTVENLRVR